MNLQQYIRKIAIYEYYESYKAAAKVISRNNTQ